MGLNYNHEPVGFPLLREECSVVHKGLIEGKEREKKEKRKRERERERERGKKEKEKEKKKKKDIF